MVEHCAWVADDDVDIRRVICMHLAELGILSVETSNGQELFDLLTLRQPPDLLCLDLNMPLVTGYEFLRVVRRRALLPATPVVVITGRTSLDDHACCRELGVHGFVAKPFRARTLRQVICAALPSLADTAVARGLL